MKSLKHAATAVGICLSLFTTAAFGVTYIAPTDREMIGRSRAIVAATVLNSYPRSSDVLGIETVTTMEVTETLKGSVLHRYIDVVEPGGTLGGTRRVTPGAPQFEPGERVMLMLTVRPDGEWAVADLGLGHFVFAENEAGLQYLVRSEEGFIGGARNSRIRLATPFLDFIRAVVAEKEASQVTYFSNAEASSLRPVRRMAAAVPMIAPYTAASYTLAISSPSDPGSRWNASSVTYMRGPDAEPGAPGGGVDAIQTALGAWSGGSGGNLSLSYGGVGGADPGIGGTNGVNTIQFERDLSSRGINAFSCSSGGILGLGGFSAGATHTRNGEQFFTISEGDVEMNKGLANCTSLLNSGNFASAVTHEVGHSIGFRHSDQGRLFDACGSNLECSGSAIMTATVTGGLNGSLASWDQHAVEAVYGNAAACINPSITSATATPSTINAGQSATLTVVATGTTPTYQWFVGNPGNTSQSAGTGASIQVSPQQTTTYWVQVTACGVSANSTAVTITVNSAACENPAISNAFANPSTISQGNSTTLSVSATGTGLTYQWYIGTTGNTSSPVPGGALPNVTVSPGSTTSYWVRVTGQCGTPANSATVTVTVTTSTCVPAGINNAFANPASITPGSSTTLFVNASGTNPTYEWYQGSKPSTATRVGISAPSITVSPTTTTTYWVRVTASCGAPVDSENITVTVSASCSAPAVTAATATPASITAGGSSTLSVTTSGTASSYQWYIGNPADTTRPVSGGTSPTITVSPTATTTYWVQVTGCNSTANSAAVTVTVAAACVAPSLTQPPAQVVAFNTSVTLTATATGEGLHYAWFRGPKNITTVPVGTDSSTFRTEAITQTTQYWVRVTNGCGSSVSSETIDVSVVIPKRRGARH